jgi:hypothetical protein
MARESARAGRDRPHGKQTESHRCHGEIGTHVGSMPGASHRTVEDDEARR